MRYLNFNGFRILESKFGEIYSQIPSNQRSIGLVHQIIMTYGEKVA